MRGKKLIAMAVSLVLAGGCLNGNAFVKAAQKGCLYSKAANLMVEADLNSTLQKNQQNKARVLFKSGGIDHTHQYITNSAIAILKNDIGASILTNTANKTTIKTYSDWPDKVGNETDFCTYSGHFYDPDTEKNWIGQKSPTAKSRAISYLEKAVYSYESGDVESALENLGKGCHYVEDLNEPHHASNLTAVNSNHSEFEKYVDENRTSYYIKGNTLSSSIYTNAYNTDTGTLLRNSAKYAKSLVTLAQDKETYDVAASRCVKQAITCTTQYLYQFEISAGIIEKIE